jgi:hypothetical protein
VKSGDLCWRINHEACDFGRGNEQIGPETPRFSRGD